MKTTPEPHTLAYNLRTWASEHAERSKGIMTLLPHDPEEYPAQSPDCVSLPGEPKDVGIIDSIAAIAQPKYGALVEDMRNYDASNLRLDMAAELLEDGNNVIVSTNHGDLVDIAVAHAAVYTELAHRGLEPSTGIIIGKMITYLGYKLGDEFVPCTSVLEILEHNTFFSYPKTESSRIHLLDRIITPEAERHNKELRKAVGKKLGEGGVLLAMAASGTTDKPISQDPTKIAMGPLGPGTMKILEHEKTYTLPLAVWYNGQHAVMRCADIPRRITTEEKAHTMMQRIAATATEATDDTTLIYTPN